jgi:hypothetical protein
MARRATVDRDLHTLRLASRAHDAWLHGIDNLSRHEGTRSAVDAPQLLKGSRRQGLIKPKIAPQPRTATAVAGPRNQILKIDQAIQRVTGYIL